MSSFGTRLRTARRRAGLSQVDVGGDRYSGSYVSHLESGRRQPTLEVAEYFAARLGVPIPELLGAEPDEFAQQVTSRELMTADLNARLAWLEQDFEQAGRDAGRAAELARRSGRLDTWWTASCLRAQSMLAVAAYRDCWELAELLAGHSVAREAGGMRAEMLVLASKAHRAEGELAKALECAQAAIAAASGPPVEPSSLAQAHMVGIAALVELGRVSDSRPLAERLREISAGVESPHARGQIAWTLGNLDFVDRRVEQAEREHARAAELLRPEVNLRTWARFRVATVSYHLEAGVGRGLRAMLEAADSALRLVGHAGDRAELAMSYARLALSEERFEETLRHIEDVLAPEPPPNRQAEAELIRAQALVRLGSREPAQRAIVRAANHLERAGAIVRALQVWRLHAALAAGPLVWPTATDIDPDAGSSSADQTAENTLVDSAGATA